MAGGFHGGAAARQLATRWQPHNGCSRSRLEKVDGSGVAGISILCVSPLAFSRGPSGWQIKAKKSDPYSRLCHRQQGFARLASDPTQSHFLRSTSCIPFYLVAGFATRALILALPHDRLPACLQRAAYLSRFGQKQPSQLFWQPEDSGPWKSQFFVEVFQDWLKKGSGGGWVKSKEIFLSTARCAACATTFDAPSQSAGEIEKKQKE